MKDTEEKEIGKMDKQNIENEYILKMNTRLQAILQGLYKMQEQKPEIKLYMVYVNDKGIYLDNKILVNFDKENNAEYIKNVIAYEKKKAMSKANDKEEAKKQSIAKGVLVSSLGTAAATTGLLLVPGFFQIAGLILSVGGAMVMSAISSKDAAVQPKTEPVETDLKETDDFSACCSMIANKLHNVQYWENCYVPPYAVLQERAGETCLRFCIYQVAGKISWNKEKYCFLKTILNLFSCYMFFVNSLPREQQQVWEQLWNDEAIILNAAQQVLGKQCGMGVTINSLGILCAMTYEGKALQGEILFGASINGMEAIFLNKAIEFHTENLRQICKLMQICKSGYALWFSVGGNVDNGKITALLDRDISHGGVDGRICFLNGKGWCLYGKEDALLEYRNGSFFLPEDGTAEGGMKSRLEQYFGASEIWGDLISMVMKLNHGAMIIVATEAREEAKRLTDKERGYKVKCKFNKELFAGFTCVDGALIINPGGICEAFGVIVDGEAVALGNVERGSRYNSAKNYIFWKKREVKEKGSEEKYAVVVRSDDGNIDLFIME